MSKPASSRAWPLRVTVQTLATAAAALLTLNAAYLVRLADQWKDPGPLLSRLAELGCFPFGPEAGVLSIEDYCPLGPIEGAVRFIQSWVAGDGISFVGPVTLRNLGVLLAVLGLAILTKKTFCSWLCPFGAVLEAIGWVGRRLGLPRWHPGARLDRRLRHGRYLALALVVAATAWAGTLVFKQVDPFYALFSLGADRMQWSAYAVLGALAAGALFHPGIWCHYLCPLGGALDGPSRLGVVQVVRREEQCSSCGACAQVCPQRIPVAKRNRVTAGLCTNCLRCLDGCPEEGALDLQLGAPR